MKLKWCVISLILYYNKSNYGPTLVRRCQKALAKHGVPLASNQIAYSLIGRQNGAQETLDTCSELGVKVLAYYPFAMVRRTTNTRVVIFSDNLRP